MSKRVMCQSCSKTARRIFARQVDPSTYRVIRQGQYKKREKLKRPPVYQSQWRCSNPKCRRITVFEGKSKSRVNQLVRAHSA